MVEVLSGSGGNWRVIDEITDSTVIKQQDKVSCGHACAEMLLKDRGIDDVNQSRIADETGVPVNTKSLGIALNKLDYSGSRVWLSGSVAIPEATYSEIIDVLMSTGSWAAILWEPLADLGHMVVVDRLDNRGKIQIRDPWMATRYKMDREEFINYWNLQAIYSLRR
ncbi:MAG TPA: hypothetical protein DEG17_04735 [Cyanobacteria bacterium UBA11149]|nr:hypothetical protein [Cyanobacteria bacterium UBA11367]HBE58062.1 hypothetical protein [Cyanobacteria bacterium UBA11366]HBK66133.1 hypothetical protein [Cyanobacteria bacterium UBA11166]HBR74957.1 hypothetical protein [Cyanobacteria bacterium UBA11159]HBS71507.1 hypothetical protein [Cyanobacteria bacterium UBA11153]HBW88195.1 hypothetical protein [Cyanobacteria bacterium UBA11149]HCA94824.1 hypothetical protein [Cyanobacteria bacterium UBA9226]